MEEHLPDYVTTDLGKIEIDPSVLRVISAMACLQVPEVHGMSGGIIGEIADWFSHNLSKGVTATVKGQSVTVDLKVVINYGAKLHEVAFVIQENVRYTLESMTGLKVKAVNVHVMDVHI